MDLSQFTSIVESCAGLSPEQRAGIVDGAKHLPPEELQEFASRLLSLHAHLTAVTKRESALLEDIEKIAAKEGKAMARDQRKRKESAEQDSDSAHLSHMFDQ